MERLFSVVNKFLWRENARDHSGRYQFTIRINVWKCLALCRHNGLWFNISFPFRDSDVPAPQQSSWHRVPTQTLLLFARLAARRACGLQQDFPASQLLRSPGLLRYLSCSHLFLSLIFYDLSFKNIFWTIVNFYIQVCWYLEHNFVLYISKCLCPKLYSVSFINDESCYNVIF